MQASGNYKGKNAQLSEDIRMGFPGIWCVCTTLKDGESKAASYGRNRLTTGIYKNIKGTFWHCQKSGIPGM